MAFHLRHRKVLSNGDASLRMVRLVHQCDYTFVIAATGFWMNSL
jgi:hypothetical protein